MSESNDSDSSAENDWHIYHNGERYEVALPWRRDMAFLVTRDYEMCLSCLKSLNTRLKSDEELLREYDRIFAEQLTAGLI